MSAESLPIHIEHLLSFLFKNRDYSILHVEHSQSFGDWYADIESGDLRLRVGSDRSQAFLLIGSSSNVNEWFDLQIVIAFIVGANPVKISDVYDFFDFDTLSSLLNQYYIEITNLFSSENFPTTEKSLKGLLKERARLMFPKLYNKTILDK